MKSIHLDLVRVTEAAAIAASEQVGRGDKIAADQSAVTAMLDRLNKIDFCGKVVIGEGKKDGAPGLFEGDIVGRLEEEPSFDIAVDPIEGTTPTSKGGYEAMSVIAVGGKGMLFSSEAFYMKKLALGKELCNYDLHLTMPLEVLVNAIHHRAGKPYNRITACMLDRPRHEEYIAILRKFGCRIRLISDCDVSGAIATCVPDSGIDFYYGIGGAPEGVISAAALKCMGGRFEGIICENDGKEISKVYNEGELAGGDVAFCATGITDGSLLRGVRYVNGTPQTHSVLMRSESGTVRWINATHGN